MAYNTKALLTDVNGKPIPQYYDVATDSFLPMSNAVELSGSNLQIQETKIFNAMEYRSATSLDGLIIDCSRYEKIYMYAISTLDQPCKVRLRFGGNLFMFWNGSTWTATSVSPIIVPASTAGTVLFNTQYPWIENLTFALLATNIVCDIAPTSGSITIGLRGVPKYA